MLKILSQIKDWEALLASEIKFKVWDWDRIGSNDLLGVTSVGNLGVVEGKSIREEGFNPYVPFVGEEVAYTLPLTNEVTSGKDKKRTEGGLLSIRVTVHGFPMTAPEGVDAGAGVKAMHGIDEETKERHLRELERRLSPPCKLRGFLQCFLVGGNDLPRADKTSSDPFVELCLKVDEDVVDEEVVADEEKKDSTSMISRLKSLGGSKSNVQKFKSTMKKKKLNPNWDENFTFTFQSWKELCRSRIEVKCWDYDLVGKNDLMGIGTITGLHLLGGVEIRSVEEEANDYTEPIRGTEDVRIVALTNETTGVDKDREEGGELSFRLKVEGFPTPDQIGEVLREIRLEDAKKQREEKRRRDAQLARNLIALSERSIGFKMLRQFRKEVERRKQANKDLAWEIEKEIERQKQARIDEKKAIVINYSKMIKRCNATKWHWALKDLLVEMMSEKQYVTVDRLKTFFVQRKKISDRYEEMYNRRRGRTEHLKILEKLRKEKLAKRLEKKKKKKEDTKEEEDPAIAAAKMALFQAREAEDNEAIKDAKATFSRLGIPLPGELSMAEIYGRTPEEQRDWEEKSAIRLLGGEKRNYYSIKELLMRSLLQEQVITLKWMKREKRKIDRQENREKKKAYEEEQARLKEIKTEKQILREKILRAKTIAIRKALGETEEEAAEDSYEEYSATGSDIEDAVEVARLAVLAEQEHIQNLERQLDDLKPKNDEKKEEKEISDEKKMERASGIILSMDEIQNEVKSEMLAKEIDEARDVLKEKIIRLKRVWEEDLALQRMKKKQNEKSGEQKQDAKLGKEKQIEEKKEEEKEVEEKEEKKEEVEEKEEKKEEVEEKKEKVGSDADDELDSSEELRKMCQPRTPKKKRLIKRRRRRKKRGRFSKLATTVGGTKYARVERVVAGKLKKVRESEKYRKMIEKAAEAKRRAKEKAAEARRIAMEKAAEARRLAEEKKKALRESNAYKVALAKAEAARSVAKQKSAEATYLSQKKADEALKLARRKAMESSLASKKRTQANLDAKEAKRVEAAEKLAKEDLDTLQSELELLLMEQTEEEKIEEEMELAEMTEEERTRTIEERKREKEEELVDVREKIEKAVAKAEEATQAKNDFYKRKFERDDALAKAEAKEKERIRKAAAVSGRIKIEVVKAVGLPNAEGETYADPFIELIYDENILETKSSVEEENLDSNQSNISRQQRFRTRTKVDTLDPEYNETFIFTVRDWEALCNAEIKLNVIDWDLLGKNDLMCNAILRDFNCLFLQTDTEKSEETFVNCNKSMETKKLLRKKNYNKSVAIMGIVDRREIDLENVMTSKMSGNEQKIIDAKQTISVRNGVVHLRIAVYGFPMKDFARKMTDNDNSDLKDDSFGRYEKKLNRQDRSPIEIQEDIELASEDLSNALQAKTNALLVVERKNMILEDAWSHAAFVESLVDEARHKKVRSSKGRKMQEELVENLNRVNATFNQSWADTKEALDEYKYTLSLVEEAKSSIEFAAAEEKEEITEEITEDAKRLEEEVKEIDETKTQNVEEKTDIPEEQKSTGKALWKKAKEKAMRDPNVSPLIKVIRAKLKIIENHKKVIATRKKMQRAVKKVTNSPAMQTLRSMQQAVVKSETYQKLSDKEYRAEMREKLKAIAEKKRLEVKALAEAKRKQAAALAEEKHRQAKAKIEQIKARKQLLASMNKEERQKFLIKERSDKRAAQLKREIEDEALLAEERRKHEDEEWKVNQMTLEEKMNYDAQKKEEEKIKLEKMTVEERLNYFAEIKAKKKRIKAAKRWTKIRKRKRAINAKINSMKNIMEAVRDAEKRAIMLDDFRNRMEDAAEKKKLQLILKAREAQALARDKEKRKELKQKARERLKEARRMATDAEQRKKGFRVLATIKGKLLSQAKKARRLALETEAAKKAQQYLEEAKKSEAYQKAMARAEAAKKAAMDSNTLANVMNSEAMQAAKKMREERKKNRERAKKLGKKKTMSQVVGSALLKNPASALLSKQVFKLKKRAIIAKAKLDRYAEERGYKVNVDWEDPIEASKHITVQKRALIEKKYNWSKKYRENVVNLQYKIRRLLATRQLNLMRREHKLRMESADWIIAQYRLRLTRRLIAKSKFQRQFMAKRIQRQALIMIGRQWRRRKLTGKKVAATKIQTAARRFAAQHIFQTYKQRKKFKNCLHIGTRVFLRAYDGTYVEPEMLSIENPGTRRLITRKPKEKRTYFCRFSIGTGYRRFRHSSYMIVNGDPVSFKSCHRGSYISSAPKIFGRSGAERCGCTRGGIYDHRFGSGKSYDYENMKSTTVNTAAKYLSWDQPGDAQLWRIYKDPAARSKKKQIESGDLVLLINEKSREALSCENGVVGTLPTTRGVKFYCYWNIIIEGYERVGDGRLLLTKGSLTASGADDGGKSDRKANIETKLTETKSFRKKLYCVERSLQPEKKKSTSLAAMEREKKALSAKEKDRTLNSEFAKRKRREAEEKREKELPKLKPGCSRRCTISIYSNGDVEINSFAPEYETNRLEKMKQDVSSSFKSIEKKTTEIQERSEWKKLISNWEKAREDVSRRVESVKASRAYADAAYNLSVASSDISILDDEESAAQKRLALLARATGRNGKKSKSVKRKEAREEKLRKERDRKRAELDLIVFEAKEDMSKMIKGGAKAKELEKKSMDCFYAIGAYITPLLGSEYAEFYSMQERLARQKIWYIENKAKAKSFTFSIDKSGINTEYSCKELASQISYAAPTVGFEGGFILPEKFQVKKSNRHRVGPVTIASTAGYIYSDGSVNLTGTREQWSVRFFLDSLVIARASKCIRYYPEEALLVSKKKRKKKRKKKGSRSKSPTRSISETRSSSKSRSRSPDRSFRKKKFDSRMEASSQRVSRSPSPHRKRVSRRHVPTTEEKESWNLLTIAVDAQLSDKERIVKSKSLNQLRRQQLAQIFVKEGWWEELAVLALERLDDDIEKARAYLIAGHANDMYMAQEALKWATRQIESRPPEKRWRDPQLEQWKVKDKWDLRHKAWLQRTARFKPHRLPEWVWKAHPEWNWLRFGWDSNTLTSSAYASTADRREELKRREEEQKELAALREKQREEGIEVPSLDLERVGYYDADGNYVEGENASAPPEEKEEDVEPFGYFGDDGIWVQLSTEGAVDSVPDGEDGEFFENMTVDAFWAGENKWYEAVIVKLFPDRCSITWALDGSTTHDVPYDYVRPPKQGSKEQRETDALTELGQRYSWSNQMMLCFVLCSLLPFGVSSLELSSFAGLNDAILQNGGFLHPNIYVKASKDNEHRRGVFTKSLIQKNELLVAIPKSLSISKQLLLSEYDDEGKYSELLKPSRGKGGCPLDQQAVAMAYFLLCQQKNQQKKQSAQLSWLHPYFASLPQSQENLIRQPESILEVLRYSPAYKIIKQRAKSTALLYENFVNREVKFEDFEVALSLVLSRSFDFENHRVMIPFADFFNHSPEAISEMKLSRDGSRYELRTLVKVEKGEEVFISYGQLSDAMLFARYGFSSTKINEKTHKIEYLNPYSMTEISLKTAVTEVSECNPPFLQSKFSSSRKKYRKKRLRNFKKRIERTTISPDFRLQIMSKGAMPSAMHALRVFLMTEGELRNKSNLKLAASTTDVVNQRNEIAVLHCLAGIGRMLTKRYNFDVGGNKHAKAVVSAEREVVHRFTKLMQTMSFSSASSSENDDDADDALNQGKIANALGLKRCEAALAKAGLVDDPGALFQSDENTVRRCFQDYKLKDDHSRRPLWVCGDGHIFLEAGSIIYQQANDFLVAISEPCSRPEFIHEFKLTAHSLYAAVSVGLETEIILRTLNRLSKTPLPKEVEDFVKQCTSSYGKAKLVLKGGHYYVESTHPETLKTLLQDETISEARALAFKENSNADANALQGETKQSSSSSDVKKKDGFRVEAAALDEEQEEWAKLVMGDDSEDGLGSGDDILSDSSGDDDDDEGMGIVEGEDLDDKMLAHALEGDEDMIELKRRKEELRKKRKEKLEKKKREKEKRLAHSFEVSSSSVGKVRHAALELAYPMLEEYDFHNDVTNSSLPIDLKPQVQVRTYQARALSKMFSNGRARSGIIVLPCGAGKTLVGITATATIKKCTLVLCSSSVAVEQWKSQYMFFCQIPESRIKRFTSQVKEPFDPSEAVVCLTTYSMLTHSGKRSADAAAMLKILSQIEWGLLLMDEVHVVPAKMFRKVISVTKSHAKLGLTATLVREDSLITDLNFLIGPKLYEANWMDLTAERFLAKVQCVEVWCPMTPAFYREMLNPNRSFRKKQAFYTMNPNKFRACEFLVKYHEERGDKILVFSDHVFALRLYAEKMRRCIIYGATSQIERLRVLENFRHSPLVNTLFISKVGDVAIDLPEATVIIQISSHFGSRRQEAQRLGRILRPKPGMTAGFNAFFYTLISADTPEMYYSNKRQQYLVEQGYTFKVVANLLETTKFKSNILPGLKEELDLLQSVLMSDVDREMADEDGIVQGLTKDALQSKKRRGNMSVLSGGSGLRYMEFRTGEKKKKKKKKKPSRLAKMSQSFKKGRL
eukprot:g1904.t1